LTKPAAKTEPATIDTNGILQAVCHPSSRDTRGSRSMPEAKRSSEKNKKGRVGYRRKIIAENLRLALSDLRDKIPFAEGWQCPE